MFTCKEYGVVGLRVDEINPNDLINLTNGKGDVYEVYI